MATTNGKGTTPKTTFISLAREVAQAQRGAVMAWLAVFREFQRNGDGDKQAFAEAFVRAVRGTKWDIWTAGTVRVNLSHIEWAEEHLTGGAKSAASMSHIIASKKGDKPKAEPAKQRKVTTVTVSESEFDRALRKAGLSPEVIAIARKAVFTTAK